MFPVCVVSDNTFHFGDRVGRGFYTDGKKGYVSEKMYTAEIVKSTDVLFLLNGKAKNN